MVWDKRLGTFVSDGGAGGGACAVCGELDEEVSGRADEALVGQVLHLVRVVDGRGVDVVPILYEQPGCRTNRDTSKQIKLN